MSSVEYIEIPIETDPDTLAQDAFSYLESVIAGWVPNDANLETIMVEALSRITAQARDVASAVPVSVFRYFGQLVDVLPQEATPASTTVTINVTNTAGYTIPAGTQIGIAQTGDVIIPFRTVVDSVVPPGSTSIAGVVIEAIEPGADGNGLTGAVTLLDTFDFVTTLTLGATTTGGQDAEDDDAYLNRLRLRLQLLAPRPILARDFAILAQDISGVARATALDGYDPEHNLMTVNESSVETNITDWVADVNCSVTQSTTQAADGTNSLRLSSTAGGDMSAKTTPVTKHSVIPGSQITAMAQFRAGASARSCRTTLMWYDGASAFISQAQGTQVTSNTTGFVATSVTGSAPGNAAYVVIKVEVAATGGAAELHYVDKMALRHGNYTSNWKIGGSAETGQDRMVAIACLDTNGNAVSSQIKTEVDDYLESLREINFLIFMVDPIYTAIDVQFTVKALTGYAASDVEASTEQAVTDYLSPKNWGLPGSSGDATINPDWVNQTTVRYLELAQVINAVSGVDYISLLQLRIAGGTYASADVVLGGSIPLPTAGTVAATIS